MPTYAKELTLHRGTDNLIQFLILNQEQKPIDVSEKTIKCRIINYTGRELLLERDLISILPVTGIMGLRLSSADIEQIDSQQCYYSLEIPIDDFDYPIFVDEAGGARGILRIVDSVLPKFLESRTVTVPTHPKPTATASVVYYSSALQIKESDFVTIQTEFDNFTGNVQFQGSTNLDFNTVYDITAATEYTEKSGSDYINIVGYHPYIRAKITNIGTEPADTSGKLSGDVVKFLTRL